MAKTRHSPRPSLMDGHRRHSGTIACSLRSEAYLLDHSGPEFLRAAAATQRSASNTELADDIVETNSEPRRRRFRGSSGSDKTAIAHPQPSWRQLRRRGDNPEQERHLPNSMLDA